MTRAEGDPSAYDRTSFSAGQDCGTRVAACIARLSALELIDGSRWWNRWRHKLMARVLVAFAEGLESPADAGGRCVDADVPRRVEARRAPAPLAGEARGEPEEVVGRRRNGAGSGGG